MREFANKHFILMRLRFAVANNIIRFLLLFSFISFPISSYSATEDVLQSAQKLLQQGYSIRAYDLLETFEDELAGNTEYDYLYGVAALDSGEPRKAIFSFQRAVMTDPDFAGARMELARAYFEIGELEQAKAEFITLQSMSPPEQTRDAIEKYLAAIENQSLSKSRGFHGYVLFGIGDDSNANNATAADSFIGFQLSEESREASSSVLLARAGFIYNYPVDYYRTYYVAANVGQRTFNDVSFANSFSLDASTGVQQTFLSGNFVGLNLQVYNTLVDGDFNNKGAMVTGQFGSKFSADNQLTSYLRLGSIRFADAFKVKDIDQAVIGLSWIHIFNSLKRPSLNLSALYGVDTAVNNDSPYDRNFYGMNVSSVVAISHRLNFFALLGLVESEFENPFFGLNELRKDTQILGSMGATWYPSKVWAVQPVLRYIKNDSNLSLYEYEKFEFLITVRSDF